MFNCGGEGNTMVVSASLAIVDNEEKVKGFRHFAEKLFPGSFPLFR